MRREAKHLAELRVLAIRPSNRVENNVPNPNRPAMQCAENMGNTSRAGYCNKIGNRKCIAPLDLRLTIYCDCDRIPIVDGKPNQRPKKNYCSGQSKENQGKERAMPRDGPNEEER
jgi:hypothetical protein